MPGLAFRSVPVIVGNALSIEDVVAVARGEVVELSPAALVGVEAA